MDQAGSAAKSGNLAGANLIDQALPPSGGSGGDATRRPDHDQPAGDDPPDARDETGSEPDSLGADDEYSSLVPDAARMITEAAALAGDDADLALLVRHYWRYAPDEELIGLTPVAMVDTAKAHLELAEQRVPGELKLAISDSADGDSTVVVDRHRRHAVPGRLSQFRPVGAGR